MEVDSGTVKLVSSSCWWVGGMWRLWLDDLDRSVFGVCVDFGFEHHVVFEYRVNGGCLDLLQGEVLVLFPRYHNVISLLFYWGVLWHVVVAL